MLSRTAIIISLIFIAAAFASAQDDTIRVDSSVVRVNVGVVDRRGQPILDLDKTKFSVYEDGVKQEISRFDVTTAPFSVVMMLDMSGSTRSFRQNIQLAAVRFLDALAPADRVAVIEFYGKINILSDFTTNRPSSVRAITVANGSGDTNLYKGIQVALQRLATEGNRRKAIVVLTDGVDTPFKNSDRETLAAVDDSQVPDAIQPDANPTFRKILSMADAQGVTIYPLALPTGDPARLIDPTMRQISMYKASRARLRLIAERTGGTLSSIDRLDQMATLYAQVAADLRSLYTLEYQPANDKRDGSWRKITVDVARPDLITRARLGYFAR